jgi:peroxiredoxin
MSLAEDLSATVQSVQKAVPAHIFSAIGRSIGKLHDSGLAQSAANAGARPKLPTLPTVGGGSVDLKAASAAGPLVLIFYRGGWCPYCNVALRAFALRANDFEEAGATIVAITPEVVDRATKTTETHSIGFPVAVDRDNAYARSLGLVFALPEALRPLYREIGIDLPDWNGDETHELPVPATYVVDREGTIRWAFVEADFTQRAEPDDVLAAVQAIKP